jgi:hypothetical protein
MISDIDKIHAIIRHINGVRDNTLILGTKLIQSGEFELGRKLIANGLIHDNSKFYGIEWQELSVVDKLTSATELAIFSHNHNPMNMHHPEYWGSIHDMPKLYLCECICDWKSRSEEFGTSFLDWIEGPAKQRFKYKDTDPVYKDIKYFASLLVEKFASKS